MILANGMQLFICFICIFSIAYAFAHTLSVCLYFDTHKYDFTSLKLSMEAQEFLGVKSDC